MDETTTPLTTEEVAAALTLSVSHVAMLCRTGKLSAAKTAPGRRGDWRIDPASAEAYDKLERGRRRRKKEKGFATETGHADNQSA